METAILIPIISAFSALFGVALNSYLQANNQFRTQQFQQYADSKKYQREQLIKEQERALQRLLTAHTLLSRTAREFSITTLDIIWRSQMTDGEYDIRYLESCSAIDELRALVALHEPHLSEDVEKIHGQMNMFWGNFKDVLYQTAKGNKIDHRSSSLSNAHAASEQIGKSVVFIKRRLAERSSELQKILSTDPGA